MFRRNITQFLLDWKARPSRKPLVLRGARQVGKTSVVHHLGHAEFSSYIYINLELIDNAELFMRMRPIKELISIIELKFNTKVTPGRTLIFIDEVQNSEVAMNQLRYFHEEMPGLHVIAAGSLLEVKIKQEGFSFPVGRVQYCYLHPVTFDEFLSALGEDESLIYLSSVTKDSTIPEEVHSLMTKRFQEYILVGGMPEAVARYVESRSYIDIDPIYESILTGFLDDVSKYAGAAKTKYLQHVIEHSPNYIGLQVKYERFGESNFRSREMSEAFDVLEKAMIISRVHASSSKQLPLISNLKKSPKLLYLDTGLVNYRLGIRSEIAGIDDINAVYQGQISEQIVGQTLLSLDTAHNKGLHYWYRDNKGAISEIDYLISMSGKLIPLEVKSGSTGTLKSLNNFMDESKAGFAVRVYSGPMTMQQLRTAKKKKFELFSLPFYLLYRIEGLIELGP